jgi:hypothetical protein
MFTDINVSEDLNEKFTTFCRSENHQLGIDLSILVLQAGAWPVSQSNLPSFSLPQELEKSVRAVSKHDLHITNLILSLYTNEYPLKSSSKRSTARATTAAN